MEGEALLQKVINETAARPPLPDEDFVRGDLSERYANAITQWLPLQPAVRVYRQFSPMRDSWEFTVYARHVDYGALRVDFDVPSDMYESWGDNRNDILAYLTRYHIWDYLPLLKKERAND